MWQPGAAIVMVSATCTLLHVLAAGSTTSNLFLDMIEFKDNSLIITVENTDEHDYVRMFETLIWVIGRLTEENEIYINLHTLSWLAEAMVPSEHQIRARCKKS